MIVPVLSKQQMSTRPAYGMRNGSVQKIAGRHKRELVARLEAEARLTVLAERNETGVDGHGELHGQLGRDDGGDDDDAVEEELGALAILLKTYSGRVRQSIAPSLQCTDNSPLIQT